MRRYSDNQPAVELPEEEPEIVATTNHRDGKTSATSKVTLIVDGDFPVPDEHRPETLSCLPLDVTAQVQCIAGCGVVSVWLAALGIEAMNCRVFISAPTVAATQDRSVGCVVRNLTAARADGSPPAGSKTIPE
jgi:hypothetical protein